MFYDCKPLAGKEAPSVCLSPGLEMEINEFADRDQGPVSWSWSWSRWRETLEEEADTRRQRHNSKTITRSFEDGNTVTVKKRRTFTVPEVKIVLPLMNEIKIRYFIMDKHQF